MVLPIALGLVFAAASPAPPRLTIIISIDQFRSDFLTRFQDLYLPANSKDGVGGFNWLMKTGANYVNSAFTHVPTETGPGHAVIGTGSSPGINGIVGNDWYDRGTRRTRYSVSDPESKDVVSGAESFSPRNLLVSTISDELENATGGKSKTVSISLKDRSAILMAGRRCDQVIWLEDKRIEWTTSTFYASKLADWVVKMNLEKIPHRQFGAVWNASLPAAAYERSRAPKHSAAHDEFGKTFPHKLPSSSTNFVSLWRTTPMANEFTVETAKRAIVAEEMGKDEVPDLLMVSLSSNDYCGHMFGPDSPEVVDISYRTDAALADLFRFVEGQVGLRDVLIVVTSDHGVMQIPEEMIAFGIPGGRLKSEEFTKIVKESLKRRFGNEKLYAAGSDGFVYLDLQECRKSQVDPAVARAMLKLDLQTIQNVAAVYTSDEVAAGVGLEAMPGPLVKKSFHLSRSPDLYVFMLPGYLISSYSGASHGSPWSYDTRVPLLFRGPGIKRGVFSEPSGPEDLAPTVCHLLGIARPSGAIGRTLHTRR